MLPPGGWGSEPWCTPGCDNPFEYVPLCIECLFKLWHWYESLWSSRHISQVSQNVCSEHLFWGDLVEGGSGGGWGTSLMSGWNVLRVCWPLVWVLLVLWELLSESVSLFGYEALLSAKDQKHFKTLNLNLKNKSISLVPWLSFILIITHRHHKFVHLPGEWSVGALCPDSWFPSSTSLGKMAAALAARILPEEDSYPDSLLWYSWYCWYDPGWLGYTITWWVYIPPSSYCCCPM